MGYAIPPHLFNYFHDLAEYIKKCLIIHRYVINPDPFIDGYKMRGRKEPRPFPLSHQYRLHMHIPNLYRLSPPRG